MSKYPTRIQIDLGKYHAPAQRAADSLGMGTGAFVRLAVHRALEDILEIHAEKVNEELSGLIADAIKRNSGVDAPKWAFITNIKSSEDSKFLMEIEKKTEKETPQYNPIFDSVIVPSYKEALNRVSFSKISQKSCKMSFGDLKFSSTADFSNLAEALLGLNASINPEKAKKELAHILASYIRLAAGQKTSIRRKCFELQNKVIDLLKKVSEKVRIQTYQQERAESLNMSLEEFLIAGDEESKLASLSTEQLIEIKGDLSEVLKKSLDATMSVTSARVKAVTKSNIFFREMAKIIENPHIAYNPFALELVIECLSSELDGEEDLFKSIYEKRSLCFPTGEAARMNKKRRRQRSRKRKPTDWEKVSNRLKELGRM